MMTATGKGVCLMALLTAVTAGEADRDGAYPPKVTVEQVRARLDQAPKVHPRLLADGAALAAVRERAGREELVGAMAAGVVRVADGLLAAPPVERKLEGRRLLGQSRRCLERVTHLAMAFHLTGDRKYADRAAREMLAAAAFSDWNPSHYLDVGEMTLALAIGYDWLFAILDEPARLTIRGAILDKGVRVPETTKHTGWIRAANNWGQVCHGGMVAGALAVLEDEPDLAARTVERALANVTRSLAAYAPNGSYPEGPGYWSYGTSFNIVLLAELQSVFGTDFGLAAAPGFGQTGEYINLVTGPSGLGFNYADGGAGRGTESALYWLAAHFARPDWTVNDRRRFLPAAIERMRGKGAAADRLFPLALLWMPAGEATAEIRMPLNWSSGGHVPITIHRSSWADPNATFVGLKGGSPRASHGQMDTGSFVLDADGLRWALDLGAEGYHGIESRGMNLWDSSQGSDRWKIFRQSNSGHNTLVIDGQLQVATGNAPITAFSDDPAFAFSVADLSQVYAGQAVTVERGLALLPSGEVLIRDRLTGVKPGATVRWQMITEGKPEFAGDREAVLRRADKHLALHLLAPTADAKWAAVDSAKPRAEWDSPNPGTTLVCIDVVTPATGRVDIAVLATPGSCTASRRDGLDLRPASEWRQAARP